MTKAAPPSFKEWQGRNNKNVNTSRRAHGLRASLGALLIGAVSLIQASCGAASSSHRHDEASSPGSEAVENSGKTISGDFVLSAVDSEYKVKGTQLSQRSMSFDEVGNFKRQDRQRVEEGAYLIGPHNELVLYIDKVNGDLLSSAHVEKFLIVSQSNDSITLQYSPSETLTWKKK